MKTYSKLVRDLIPDIICRDGKECEWEVMNEADYLKALDQKLTEEAQEFCAGPCEEEIADVLEVIDALCLAHGYDMESILRIKAEKKAQRGGFEKRILLQRVL